ncbi:M28 family metallopeptidase [Caldimonas brevitalea]|uniref:Aminopeptidase n=1 Tax=Caldimonas brevitalea TaxID=413882 RepID=A0A0G3BHW8_9BURK|nr:M28 family peptidase [Caldimonas brevitalea]AKJ27578.1 hypothetical protein AAW51_0887 [Caldimonas brevitalea]
MLKLNEYPSLNMRTLLATSVSVLALTLAGCGGGDDDDDDPPEEPKSCADRANDTPDKLMECVTREGVLKHLQKLDEIAKANNNTRASGTMGYELSLDYAEGLFRGAGYKVWRQAFPLTTSTERSASVVERTAPTPTGPVVHHTLEYSGSGDVTAAVQAPAGNVNGCEESDFAGFTAGRIALIQRGICPFAQKANNAIKAGAVGAVIYNNVDAPLDSATLGDDFTGNIPVVGISQTLGTQLAAVSGLQLRLRTDVLRQTIVSHNLLAETTTGDANKVVMVGAHLDSVEDGPGINDNGSGSAAIIETALYLAKTQPKNKLRFALWGGEESGLVGSTYYVSQLSAEEKAKIALYLNFDMIASPNPAFFIYDGDNSDEEGEPEGPGGSEVIEKDFEAFYNQRNKPFKGTDFDGRSDYGAFIDNGIPAGGLFSGAEGIKTPEEAALWGGEANVAYDKCYHQACDDLTNLNLDALDLNSDAVAASTIRYAQDVEAVVSKREPPAAVARQQALKPKRVVPPRYPLVAQ